MVKKESTRGARNWIEVDTVALANNYNIFRDLIGPKCKLMAVAKSNAYGHDIVQFSKAVDKLGVDFIAVDTVSGAMKLKSAGVEAPILVFDLTLPENIQDAVDHDIRLTVSNFEALDNLKNVVGKPKIHLFVDTGLHQTGFFVHELQKVLEILKKDLPNVELEGVYTHFASAKDPDNLDYTYSQLKNFEEAIEIINSAGYKPLYHCAATEGLLNIRESKLDMVRIGVGLMGLWPSKKLAQKFGAEINLRPILSWRAMVVETKQLKAGDSIGYDQSKVFIRDSKIAVISVGYWHGIRRSLSDCGEVLIVGKRCPIVGFISMNTTCVDVTDAPEVKIGDVVTIIGKDGDAEILVEEMADKAKMYRNEFITLLNSRILRIYV